MSRALERIRRLATTSPRRLLFAEAGDPRIVGAAARIARDGIARVRVLGNPDEAQATARRADVTPGAVGRAAVRDRGRERGGRIPRALPDVRGVRRDPRAERRAAGGDRVPGGGPSPDADAGGAARRDAVVLDPRQRTARTGDENA